MMTHLQGPWFSDAEYIRQVKDNGLIASLYISPNQHDERNKTLRANARLIAAAPDMFDQLKRELEWLKHIEPQVTASQTVMLGFKQAIGAIGRLLEEIES